MGDQMMKKKLFTIFNEDGTTMESEEQKQYLLLLRFVDDCREKTYEIITDYNNLIDYFIENIDEIISAEEIASKGCDNSNLVKAKKVKRSERNQEHEKDTCMAASVHNSACSRTYFGFHQRADQG